MIQVHEITPFPQAKPKPVRPRTLGPPSQTQAGPAQDPWPPKPKPSRSGLGNTIGNTIGNSIGNKQICLKNVKFQDKLIFCYGGLGDS